MNRSGEFPEAQRERGRRSRSTDPLRTRSRSPARWRGERRECVLFFTSQWTLPGEETLGRRIDSLPRTAVITAARIEYTVREGALQPAGAL